MKEAGKTHREIAVYLGIKDKNVVKNCVLNKTGKYAIQEMCKFFGESRSGYYSFLKRRDKSDKDEALAQKISICLKHSNNTYGYMTSMAN